MKKCSSLSQNRKLVIIVVRLLILHFGTATGNLKAISLPINNSIKQLTRSSPTPRRQILHQKSSKNASTPKSCFVSNKCKLLAMVSFLYIFYRKIAADFPMCLITNINMFGCILAHIPFNALQKCTASFLR